MWLHHLLYKLSLPGEYLPTNDRSGRVDKGTLRAYVLGITRGFLYSTNFVGKSKYVLLTIIDLLHDCKATKFKFYYKSIFNYILSNKWNNMHTVERRQLQNVTSKLLIWVLYTYYTIVIYTMYLLSHMDGSFERLYKTYDGYYVPIYQLSNYQQLLDRVPICTGMRTWENSSFWNSV